MAEKIKIDFLGTGSAIPTKRRNHVAVLLRFKDEVILFDCGEGTQRQFRKAKLNPCKITKILISHWHGDHVLGLPGLLQTLMLNGYNKELEIYGPKGTNERVRKYFDLIGRKGQNLDVRVREISDEKFFENSDFYLESKSMEHDSPCNAYAFVVKEKTRLDKEKLKKLKVPNSSLVGELVKGKVVEIGGKKFDGKKLIYSEPARKVSFVLDTRMNKNAVEISKNSDVLICESTYSAEENEIAEEYGHLTSENAAMIAKKAKAKKLILFHLSQRYDEIPKVILGEAKVALKGTKIDVSVAEDFDKVEL